MKLTLRTKATSFGVECDPGERVLYAALRAGFDVPYECATGTCGTCKARARPGTVEETWPDAPGHAYLKRDRGEFLMCQGNALRDCEILVPARVEPIADTAPIPQRFSGRLENVRYLTHDVVSFSITTTAPVSFDAGQFVVLATDDLPGYRAYSMVNRPHTTHSLHFVLKKKPGGSFSSWFDSEREGTELDMFGPLGKATYNPGEDKSFVCIAGGSGIAGIMSILAHAAETGHFATRRGDVFFGVRTHNDLFYMEELARLVEASGGALSVTVALSDEQHAVCDARIPPGIDMADGFVHTVAHERMTGAWNNQVAFVAGPPPLVDGALRVLVTQARLPVSSIRYDKFS